MPKSALSWCLALAVSVTLPSIANAQKLVTGPGVGMAPVVRVIDASGTDTTFMAYDPVFPGGVRVALGDVNGDGVLDIITGAGPGGGPHVRIWNGTDLTELGGFFAYDPAFTGGVFVAAGDITGDGKADIITGAGPGGGPHVRVFDGATLAELGGFFAYDPAFPGGVFVAAGDVTGDGVADIVTGAGPGGGPHVRIWNGTDFTEVGGFFAYDPAFGGGVHVAVGDINGDGKAEIVTGAGPGGGPHVRVWNGADLTEIGGFFAYNPAFGGGVMVGLSDLDRDGKNEIITAPGPGAPAQVRIWSGTGFSLWGEYLAAPPAFTGGVFIGSVAENPSTDHAPSVATTTPADGAMAIPVNANLVVTFSEPVHVAAGAFVLECPTGTPIALTNLTASPATQFTLNPNVDLPTSTTCTLRVVASQVTDDDDDDPPDTMAADATVTFTTSSCTAITVSPTSVPGGNLTLPYGPVTFTQVGGTPPITWSVSSGTLPNGVQLAPSTGILSGTPTQSGAFPITITATAANACSGSASMTLNIATGPNQAPSFTVGPNQTVAEDAGAQTVTPWATAISPGPPDESAQTVTFNITGNTNAALFSAAPAVSPTGVLTYTSAPNASGTATITLTLSDNGGTAGGGVDTSAPQTFVITVTAVNDAPSFTPGAGPTSAEDAGPQTVNPWATAISPGPPNEAGQTLAFMVTGNTNPALFSAGPAVSPAGVLTYTSAPNAFGTANITLVLQDNGGTANGGVNTSAPVTFAITVTPVNDLPALTTPTIAYATAGNTQLHVAGATLAGVASIADAGSILTKSGPTDIDGPSAPTVVPFSGTTANGGTVALVANGSFTYVPAAGFTGVDTFNFQVTDSVIPVTGTINITVSNMVWYVNNQTGANNPAAGSDGRSTNAFETLAAAGTASAANDIIFVFNGDSATTPLTGGITVKNGQKLHGEGIGLTVGSFVNIVAAGTRPQIESAGNTIAVLANTANGDRTGVEIRGLDLNSTAGNAIDVTSANTQSLGVRISENIISGSGGTLDGIDINQGSTGTATLAVHDNSISASGNGLDIIRTAGTLIITTFDDNTVLGNTLGSGIVVNGPVTFDATPGGTLDPVNGGTTRVGVSGDGVGGAGMVMTSVTGSLVFGDLDLFADTGAALSITGTGAFTGAAGTQITSIPGLATLVANGPAVSLTNLTANLQPGSLTSTNSATTGVSLVNVDGTFSAASGTITNAAGTAFAISGGTANVTYNGTMIDNVDDPGSNLLVSISGTTGGTKSFGGALTDGNAGDDGGISLASNTGSTIAFSGGMTLATGAAPAFTASAGGTITVTGAGNTIGATGATALDLANVTIGAGGMTFQSTSSGGGVRNVKLTGVTGGAIALGTGSLTGATGAAILVGDGAGGASTGGTAAISYGGSITTTGTARAVDIQDRAAGAGNITLSGTITHSTGNANVIFLDGNAAGTIAFSGPNSVLNGGTATAVSLTNNTGATINFTGGGLDIDATSGGGFHATGGGTVAVTGSSNTLATTTSTALNVSGTAIGAGGLNFVSINSTGSSGNVGINLSSTGTAAGLNVTGNGIAGTTAGEGTGGTISNKSGDAVVLNNTAHVRLNDMIIGVNAATAGEGQPDATNNIGGDAIKITSVTPAAGFNYGLTLDNVTISRTGGDGIDGLGGGNVGLKIVASRFLNIGDDLALTNESALNFGTGFPSTDQITGTVHIDDSMFAGFTGYGFTVENAGNGTLNMTVEDSVFKNNDGTTVGNSAIQIILDGSSSANNPKLVLLVEDTAFTNLDLDGVEVTTDPGATSNVTIRGTTYSNPNGDNAIHMVSGSIDADDVESMTVWIEDTTITSQRGTLIFLKSGAGTYNATVTNTAGFTGKLDSGINVDGGSAHIGRGIEVLFDADNADAITATVRIENQTLRNIGVDGIHVATNETNTTAGANTFDITIQNNIIGEVGAETGRQGTGEGIEIRAGGTGNASSAGTMNLLANGNTIRMRNPGAANPGMEGIDLDAEADFTLNATVTANNFNNPANTGENVSADSETATSELHLDIRNNTSSAGTDPDYILTQTAGIFRVEGPGTGAVTAANIQAAQTSGTASVTGTVLFNNNVNVTMPATPPTPTLPPVPPAALLAGGGGVEAAQWHEVPALTQAELDVLSAATVARRIAGGLTTQQTAAVRRLTFEVADLPEGYLAEIAGNRIRIDRDAAGRGWFVDRTPLDDVEFANTSRSEVAADSSGAPAGYYDLLTAVTHEIGHGLRRDDLDPVHHGAQVMTATLPVGVRRLWMGDKGGIERRVCRYQGFLEESCMMRVRVKRRASSG
jgi:Bacterial Ig-like domain/Bacterial Ig domain/FG-GAP-like repeat